MYPGLNATLHFSQSFSPFILGVVADISHICTRAKVSNYGGVFFMDKLVLRNCSAASVGSRIECLVLSREVIR